MPRKIDAVPRQKSPQIAASWNIESWPALVWPNTPARARYVVRVHRDSLMTHGALARVGREIIVFGPRYQRWLERHSARVASHDLFLPTPRTGISQ